MRKIVASFFISLDGVMQAPGGPQEDTSGGFQFGGWTVPHSDETTGGTIGTLFDRPYALLLGRKTYDIFAGYWPHHGGNAFADAFNAAPKYVATHRHDDLDWNNSKSLGDDPIAALRDLKAQEGPVLIVQGSSDFMQTLLATDLLDEISLLIFPVVLGDGKRLFRAGTLPTGLKLTRSQTSSTGVVMVTYERGGEVETGSF